jgi:hypothetical protein
VPHERVKHDIHIISTADSVCVHIIRHQASIHKMFAHLDHNVLVIDLGIEVCIHSNNVRIHDLGYFDQPLQHKGHAHSFGSHNQTGVLAVPRKTALV